MLNGWVIIAVVSFVLILAILRSYSKTPDLILFLDLPTNRPALPLQETYFIDHCEKLRQILSEIF